MKKTSFIVISFLLLIVTFGQIPHNYYASAEGKKQQELKIGLAEIISNGYVQRTYKDLWTDFYTTDARPEGDVWDMYSNCTFTFGVDQDTGSGGTQECDKYNREHAIPNSWFGGEKYPMYTDLFHVYPVDKYVNNERADYPYGETINPVKIYSNGGKKGLGDAESGYTGMVFEPAEEYKGDFARTVLYMATRYLNIDFTQNSLGEVVLTYSNATCDLTDYAINLYLKWHRNDPVNKKETDRNNAVYGIQHNRNPFIDYPELAEHIWGNLQDVAWQPEVSIRQNKPEGSITITKMGNEILVQGAAPGTKVEVYSLLGQVVYSEALTGSFISLIQFQHGVYIVRIGTYVGKVVW